MASAKATAGASRSGLAERGRRRGGPRGFRGCLAFAAAASASALARAAAAISFSIRAIRSLRLVACSARAAARRSSLGQLRRRRRRAGSAVSAISSSIRARSSASVVASVRIRSRSRRDLVLQRNQLAEVGGELVGGVAEIRNHRAEEDGAADRGKRVFRPDQDRRRRPAADPLQRGQHLGEHVALGLTSEARRSHPRCGPAPACAVRSRRSRSPAPAPACRCRSASG